MSTDETDISEEVRPEANVDLLQSAQVEALAEREGDSSDPAPTEEWSLLAVEDLRNIMAQFPPMAMKDVELIEKGVENFFLFHQEPDALLGPEALKYLGRPELHILEERRALVSYEYLNIDTETGRLVKKTVLIRPASLKGEQVERVKEACARHSISAFLRYVSVRDKKSAELAKEGRLGEWVSGRVLKSPGVNIKELDIYSRADLLRVLTALPRLSVEYFLSEDCKLQESLLVAMLPVLNQNSKELLNYLESFKEQSPEIRMVLESRGELPFLIELGADFHILQPPGSLLIELKGHELSEHRSEVEWILELYTQIAGHILRLLLPEEDFQKLHRARSKERPHLFLQELKKHPSFYLGEEWEGGAAFLQAFGVLLRQVELIAEVRREYLIRELMQRMLEKLNMRFEPWLFTPEELEILPDEAFEYISRKELFSVLNERMRSLPDLYSTVEKRRQRGEPNVYYIYKSNIPGAFANYPKRRNFLHLLCKENGQKNGIYDSLIDTSLPNLPEQILDEQIALGRAIRNWEEELEKERQRKLLASMGFWERIILFFKKLFGMGGEPKRRIDDFDEESVDEPSSQAKTKAKPDSGRSRNKRSIQAGRDEARPKERILSIPKKVQQAIDFVERYHHGLVWVDEVLYALGSVKFTETKISDLLYYDKLNRYKEIRSVSDIRPLFVQEKNLNDPRWLAETQDYLENITHQRSEYEILLNYLKELETALER